MKRTIILIIAILLVGGGLKAQSQGADSAYYNGKVYHFGFTGFNSKGDSLFTSIQIEAGFHGGAAAWKDYLIHNLRTSIGDKYIKIPKGETSAKATVVLNFLIDKYGTIDSVKVDSTSLASVHEKVIAEAVRVIKEGPQWTPAWQNGKNVAFRAKQAITFVVSKD